MKKKVLAVSLAVVAVLGSSNIVSAKDRTIVNDGETVTINNETFDSINYEGFGGAINSEGDLTVNKSNFTNNSAIINDGYYDGMGGAINANGNLEVKDSIFNSNTAGYSGGAISGTYLNIDNSQFINNKTLYDPSDDFFNPMSGGGAIFAEYTDGSEYLNINNSLFQNNNSSYIGSAILSTINTEINNSTFISNYANNNGGAIYLLNLSSLLSGLGITNNIDGKNIIKNSIFTSNYSNTLGGAIFNGGGSELNIINSTFKDNYAKQGGAINTGTVNIISDSGNTEFKGNYIVDENNSKIENNAIYVVQTASQENDSELTLTAKNNGTIYMYDNIDGGSGYNVNITGDGTGTLYLYDDIKNGDVTTGNITIDTADNQTHNYNLKSLTSGSDTNYKIDVDLTGLAPTSDTFTVGEGSSGTVNVSEVNFVGDSPSDEFTVQLLNAEDDNIQLAVDSSIAGENHKLGTVTRTSQDTITPTAKWNQTFNKYTQNGTNYGNIDVATTNTTNDSLQLKVTSTEWDEKTVSGSMGDTLALVNQLETTENRNFNFDTANDVYEVKSDLGTSSASTMNVNGFKSGETRSTINGNNYNMFVLSNPTTLNINNVKIQGANSVASGTNKNAVINMNNVELKNNASGITTAGSVNISGKSVFDNNGNGIEVTDENSIITLNGLDGEGYDVVFKDKLKGVSGAKLNLKAGQVEFHKSVTDLDINMDGTTANLKSDNVFNGQNLTVASASNISMINNSVGTMQLNSLTLNDNMNLGVDVDLANKSMDRISANTYNLGDNKINVDKMNLLSDAKEVRTDIEFADEGLRNNVTTSVSEVAYSPIYKYGVKYDQNNGEFQFTRSNSGGGGGGGDNPQPQPAYNDLNPAIMASPVAAQMGGYAGMLDNYSNALNHMDMYMLKPKSLRAAELNANKYAIADGSPTRYYSNETNTNGIWIRPYTSFDSVGLKNGPRVNNLSYGSFIGGDFGMHDFGKGLYGEFSPYISYQGAHQNYSGNSVYQNGGSLGFAGTLYKGNFFTGLTAGVGANVTEANTMYGHESFPMLTTGVASKTGYNIEFSDGKFIIQPSLQVSYTFVNTFDYTNAAGVRIDTAPLHAVQINPNIRFSFNTKNHWQPYAFVGMNWNIMNAGHFKAADTTLPELSMRPYVQYGLGIQKLFSDNFTAFAQVAIRNGGRNGVGGTLGLKWFLGGQPQKQEEQKPKNVL